MSTNPRFLVGFDLGSRGHEGLLLRADANGILAPVTDGFPSIARGRTATWADFDGDGRLDLYGAVMDGRARLLRNRGGCRFDGREANRIVREELATP